MLIEACIRHGEIREEGDKYESQDQPEEDDRQRKGRATFLYPLKLNV